jgi:hypothetical protein
MSVKFMTVAQLRARCKRLQLTRYSHLPKADLVALVLRAEAEHKLKRQQAYGAECGGDHTPYAGRMCPHCKS